jgi:hypothetical protein
MPRMSVAILPAAIVLCAHAAHGDTGVWQYPANNHFYKLYDVNMTPQAAYRFCAAKGAYVVSIGNAKESAFLTGMLRTSAVRSTMIGLGLREMVQVKLPTGLVRYELRGRWADGVPFVYRSDEDPADPAAQNSFERFDVIPHGIDVIANNRGVWYDTWVGRVFKKTGTTTTKPYTTETYNVSRGIDRVTCEWEALPTDP